MHTILLHLAFLFGTLTALVQAQLSTTIQSVLTPSSTPVCPNQAGSTCSTAVPSITFVSTDPYTQGDSYRTGSLSGNVLLYLKGTGLSPEVTATKVLIGDKSCVIEPVYTSFLQIACRVPSASSFGILNIYVTISGKKATCDTLTLCNFRYEYSQTPVISYFVPSSINPSSSVKFGGLFRVTDSTFFSLKLGDYICDFSTLGTQRFDANSLNFVKCNVGPLPAGLYKATLNVLTKGQAVQMSSASTRVLSEDSTFNIAIIPQITSISKHTGTAGGAVLNITGSGFSRLTSENYVYFGDTPCDILTSNNSYIQCLLMKPSAVSQTGLQPGHTGLLLRTFTIKDSLDTLKLSSTFTQGAGVKTYLMTAETEYDRSEGYSEAMEGFFYAPVSGTYKFLLSAQGAAQLFFSDTPLSKVMSMIAEVKIGTEFRDFYNPSEPNQISQGIQLEGGNYYYFQAIHLGVGKEHLTVGAIVPSQTRKYNSLRKVISLKIEADVVLQQATVRIKNTTTLIQFGVRKLTVITKSSGFSFPGTTANVESNMESIGFPIQVTNRTLWDASNKTTTNQALAVAVTYSFVFLNISGLTLSTQPMGYPATSVEVKLENLGTPLVNGYFELGLLTSAVTINYDETAESLRTILMTVPDINMPRVSRYGNCKEGCQWIIQFDGNPEDLQTPQVVSYSMLTGGATSPVINITVLQDSASNDLLFAPIPYDMVYTAETSPQIKLETKGILASCPNSQCYFQVDETTSAGTIIDFSLNNDTLVIFIQIDQTLTVRDFEIYFAKVKAKIVNYDPTAKRLFAKIPLISNTSIPMIVAGVHIPQITIKGSDILQVASNVTGVWIKPTITEVEVHTEARSTGYVSFTIRGSGFGYNMDKSYGTTINIDEVPCALQNVANNWAFCSTDVVVTSGVVILTVNGFSDRYGLDVVLKMPLDFQVIDRTVDPYSGENLLTIQGYEFDESTSIVLSNIGTCATAACHVCSFSSDTISCVVQPLAPGVYSVIGNTFTLPDKFYQMITTITIPLEIYSVEPEYGSQLGGTILTIRGQGFSTVLTDNQVIVGNRNYKCNVFLANNELIMCTTSTNAYNLVGPLNVTVFQRLEYTAECKGSCYFTYSDLHTPNIYSLAPYQVLAGAQVTVTGTNFTDTTQMWISNEPVDILSVTDNSMQIIVPPLVAGNGLIVTGYDPIYGNFKVADDAVVYHTLQVKDYSPKNGSLAGTILTVTGKGFSNAVSITVGTKACTLIQVQTNLVTCSAPAGAQGALLVKQDIFQKSINTSFVSQTNLTPTITAISGIPITVVTNELVLTLKGAYLNISSPIKVTIQGPELSHEAQVQVINTTAIQAKFTKASAGTYKLIVQVGPFFSRFSIAGFNGTVNIPVNVNSITPVISSIGGGSVLEFTGSGFTDQLGSIAVEIGGFECPIISASFEQIKCTIPPLVTKATQIQYKLGQEAILKGTYFSSSASEKPINAFDNTTITSFKAVASSCYFGVDFGENLVAELKQIKYYPETGLDLTTLAGSVFEGSLDNINYITLATIGTNVYDGWNTIDSPMADQTVIGFRYLRYRRSTSTAKCNIAEVEIRGTLFSNVEPANLDSVQISASVEVNGKSVVLPYVVEYRKDHTPLITTMSPTLGTAKGGTQVYLSGINLSGVSQILIDNTPCTIVSVFGGMVTCTTGALTSFTRREQLTGSLDVYVTGMGKAITSGFSFLYAEKWSDKETWGCGGLPKEHDSVHIETGMNLILDISPPPLVALIIEGGLIFADTNINLVAEYILVRNGFLQIGDKFSPITSNVNITLVGSRGDDQLPVFGNKVLGLYEGTIDIHGMSRVISSELGATATKGQTVIEVAGFTDWRAGEQIVITSTNYNATQNEKKTIVSITDNTIVLDSPLQFTHLAKQTTEVEGQAFSVAAEVVLLTRNILIQGDYNSDSQDYGAHLLFYDPGTESTIVRIANVEIANAGQANVLGRFPINFQDAGNQMRSYITGVSIHDTYQRGIQVKGTSYLSVSWSVLYSVQGYGINIEDGVERFNTFEENIIIGCELGSQYITTQESPAGIRITNPTNFFRRNKVLANPSYGFWFDLKSYAGGAYTSKKICPSGERLGIFEENTAAFNLIDGIRFDTFIPRTYPCRQTQYTDQPNPFAKNLPVAAIFLNNNVIGNKERGVKGYSTGALVFDGLKAVDNGIVGIELILSDESPINATVIKNSFIIGSTSPELSFNSYRGIILTRSESMYLDNVVFVNFTGTRPAIESDASYYNSYYYDSGVRTVFLTGLKFYYVELKVKFVNSALQIFRDLDGSLVGILNGGTLVNDFPHLRGITGCSNIQSLSGLACDSNTEFRRVVLHSITPQSVYGLALKVLRLSNSVDEALQPASNYSTISYRQLRAPYSSYALPVALGYSYKIFFDKQAELLTLSFELSPHWNSQDASVTFVFNHTAPREDYDFNRWDRIKGTQTVENSTVLWNYNQINGAAGKLLGNWYHSFEAKRLYVAAVGGNGTKVTFQGYVCRVNCPQPVTNVSTNGTGSNLKYWSNQTIWPGGVLPKEGDSVMIPKSWILVLDINPPALSTLDIQGELRFDAQHGENVLVARNIWVRGKLVAGSATEPFTQNVRIVLNGSRTGEKLTINNRIDPATKLLAVTGQLLLFGQQVTERVKLVQSISPGAKIVKTSGNLVGWKAGYLVALTSSLKDDPVYEVGEIESISGNDITLKNSVAYFHYSGVFAQNSNGNSLVIDYSTQVILLNRSIQIQGTKEDNWGARVLVTEEYFDTYTATGRAELHFISLEYCGQPTSQAALSFALMSNVTQDVYSIVNRSIIIDSQAWGVTFLQAQNVLFTRNSILSTKQFGVFFYENNYQIDIIENYILSTTLDSSTTYSVLEGMSSGVYLDNLDLNLVDIRGNVVAGSQVSYILKAYECGNLNPYSSNVAYSAEVGYLILTEQNKCAEVSDFTAYRTDYGVLSYFEASQIVAKSLKLTDNGVSINLNAVGKDDISKTLTVKDSLFVAFALSGCPECYARSGSCESKYAVMLGTATQGGKNVPPKPQDDPWTIVNSPATFNSEQILMNNTFANFQDNILPQCKNNFIMKTNKYASDYTPYTTLRSTNLINVQPERLVYFEPARAELSCGNMSCTGLDNVLITDADGTFLGTKGSLISNNPSVIRYSSCSLAVSMNGHICYDQNFKVLEFESLDSDKFTRNVSPVIITNEQGFLNTVNAFKGHTDVNQRLARFVSLVEKNRNYTVEFPSNVPSNLLFKMEAGVKTEYTIIKLKYFESRVVTVTNPITGQTINPVPAEFNKAPTIKETDACGANYYDRSTNILNFKLTGDSNCKLYIQKSNGLAISIRYDMTEEEFFQQGGSARFIDKVASVLNIPHSMIRVISLSLGSVILDIEVVSDIQDGQDTRVARVQLKKFGDLLREAYENGELNVYGKPVMDFSYRSLLIDGPTDTFTTSGPEAIEQKSLLVLGLAIGGAVVAIVLVSFFIYKYRQYKIEAKKVMKITPITVKRPSKAKIEFAVVPPDSSKAGSNPSSETQREAVFDSVLRKSPSMLPFKNNQAQDATFSNNIFMYGDNVVDKSLYDAKNYRGGESMTVLSQLTLDARTPLSVNVRRREGWGSPAKSRFRGGHISDDEDDDIEQAET